MSVRGCASCGGVLPVEAVCLARSEAWPPQSRREHIEDAARMFSVLGEFCSRRCLWAYLVAEDERLSSGIGT